MYYKLNDAEDFFGDHGGWLAALVCIVLAIVGGMGYTFSEIDAGEAAVRTNYLYQNMQEYNPDTPEKDQKAIMAIKRFLEPQGEMGGSSVRYFLDSVMPEFEESGHKDWYTDKFLAEYELLDDLVSGKTDYREHLQDGFSWKKHLKHCGAVGGIGIQFIFGLVFALGCWIENTHSMFKFNYKDGWLVFTLLCFSPGIIPFMLLEGLWWGIVYFLWKGPKAALFHLSLPLMKRNYDRLPERLKNALRKHTENKEIKKAAKKAKADEAAKKQHPPAELIAIRRSAALEEIEAAKSKFAQSREQLVNAFRVHLKQGAITKSCRVNELKKELSECGSQVANLQRLYASEKAELAKLEALRENEAAVNGLLEQFDKCSRLPGYLAVKVRGQVLCAYTDLIIVEKGGKRYEVGYIRVQINIVDDGFSIYNLSSTHPEDLHHPYGGTRGYCFGDIGDSVRPAIRQKDYFTALVHIRKSLGSWEGDKPDKIEEFLQVA